MITIHTQTHTHHSRTFFAADEQLTGWRWSRQLLAHRRRLQMRYCHSQVKILFDLLLSHAKHLQMECSDDDNGWNIATFLTNFALIIEETKYWNFTEDAKLSLVQETVEFI